MPEVSVVIPAFNAGRTIDAALASVFAQTYGDFEVIVADDGSTDDTAARVAAFGSRVTYCRQPHAGMARAWNTGLQSASGRLVMMLEATDLWMPRKLDRQVRYFDAYPETGLLHGDAIASGSPTVALLESADIVPVSAVPAPPSPPGSAALPCRSIVFSTVAFRRSALDAVGLFDAELAAADAARELWSRLASRFPVGQLPLPMAVVRSRTGSRAETPFSTRSRSLLQDTRFRRARSAVTSAAHALDDAVARCAGRPLRILFEAASPMSLAVFGPVFRQLRQDPRLEFWFTSCDRSWDARTIFAPAGITDRVVPADAVRWAKFDAYINTDFWDMTWLPRRARRVHFFHGVAGKYGLDAPVKIAPVVATFDRLMFPNRDRLNRYAEAGLIDADSPQGALIGYPKVDCLVDGSLNREATLARIGVDTTLPTVLYAPTWSPYSSLNTMGHRVIAALGRLGVNVVVKLHDRSYDATTRGSGGVDWKQRLLHLCQRHGAHLVQDADASPWLHAADLLVTDHSSVGFEFMLLDRPIVVIDSPDLITNAGVNLDKVAMLRGAAFVARDSEDIGPEVRRALDAPLEHHHQRRSVSAELFYCPGSAAARAVQCVYDLLALPMPDAAGAASTARVVPALASLVRSL